MAEIHIPGLAPEVLFHVGPVPVTNTVVNVWIALIIFLIMGIVIKRKVAMRPGKFQNGFEYILELLLPYFDQVTGDRKKDYSLFANSRNDLLFYFTVKLVGALAWHWKHYSGHMMVLRPANTDLNLTVAMALVSVIASHIFAFISIGVFTHVGKFVQFGNIIRSFKKGPMAVFSAVIEFAVGLLEIVSEMAKVLSLSLRLFGNIFAGEVLISVMSALVAAIVPTPFMLLELLVGLIQASVFAMLTLVYMTVASSAPHGADDHH